MRGPVPWYAGPIRSCGRTSLGSRVASALRPGPPRRWQPSRYRCHAPPCSPSPRSVGRPATHLVGAPSEAAFGRARPAWQCMSGSHMPGLDPSCHGDADEAVRVPGGRVSQAHRTEAVDGCGLRAMGDPNPVRRLLLGRSAQAGDGLSGPRVHRSLPPGPCGPCSLPGQRAPEFFTEQNGGRPMTRAMPQTSSRDIDESALTKGHLRYGPLDSRSERGKFDRVGGPVDRERRLAEAPVVWTEAVDAPTTPAAGRFHLAKRQTGGQMALALGRVAIRGRHVRSVSVRRGD